MIPYDENTNIITTIGQLNFFKWAILNKVVDYIVENYDAITQDMNTRLTLKNKHSKTEDSISTISSTDESSNGNGKSSNNNSNSKTRKKREELSVSACLSIRKEFVPVKITF
jgi:hypothetical protein